jgi:hypothetical protein
MGPLRDRYSHESSIKKTCGPKEVSVVTASVLCLAPSSSEKYSFSEAIGAVPSLANRLWGEPSNRDTWQLVSFFRPVRHFDGLVHPAVKLEVVNFRPASSRIAFWRMNEGVFTALPATAGQSILLSGALITQSPLLWAPDSSQLAYAGFDNGNGGIYVSTPTVAGATQVSGAGTTGAASWSPNSVRIQYTTITSSPTSPWELHTALADGGGSVKITPTPRPDQQIRNPRWVSDSSRVIYAADSDAWFVYGIFAAHGDSSGSVRLSGTILPGTTTSAFFAVRP